MNQNDTSGRRDVSFACAFKFHSSLNYNFDHISFMQMAWKFVIDVSGLRDLKILQFRDNVDPGCEHLCI